MGADRAGILFDLDETLIDRSASIRSYAGDFWTLHADRIEIDQAAFIDRFVALDGNGYVPRPAFFGQLAQEFAAVGLDAAAMESHYLETVWRAPVLMDGALDGLAGLAAAGVPLGIVSNGRSAVQRRKIANTALGSRVDAVFISEEVGVKKPDPAIFLAACEGLGIDPDASWFVGDHPLLDVQGSKARGFRAIWVQGSTPWPDSVSPCYDLAVDRLASAMKHLQTTFAVSSGGTAT